MTIGLFVGSFDPVTLGHANIIERSLKCVDKLLIAVSVNSEKKGWLSIDQRMSLLEQLYQHEERIKVVRFDNELTVHFAKKHGVDVLIRGLRTSSDFTYEQQIGQMNRALAPELETVYLITDPVYQHVSSSMAREIDKYDGDLSLLLPKNIVQLVKQMRNQ
ncbi:pantetheine-phosphate adenylyltransferase [Atopobacter phocae]|uniref:pantetheine-phosphate adenylyltransferase n=1 Tax=Atopobacter phocae TaxID=136492 RepID=UPI000471FAF2|nr:pantetheine-phosphate adenylyltransferase [Atopobacter phocae]